MNKVHNVEPGSLDYQILMVFLNNTEPKKPSNLKDTINVSHSTLNSALKRMVDAGYVTWEKYGKVYLDAKGQRALEHIQNHHHLIELFFMDTLGMEEEAAHEESLRLAPHFSCRMIDRLCSKYPACSRHERHQPFVKKQEHITS